MGRETHTYTSTKTKTKIKKNSFIYSFLFRKCIEMLIHAVGLSRILII
jgi:hypothetical protein